MIDPQQQPAGVGSGEPTAPKKKENRRDNAAAEKLAAPFYGLAKGFAWRTRRGLGIPGYFDQELLAAAALRGLLAAALAWDETRKVPFEAYARLRMAGAIKDEIRDNDHATRKERDSGTFPKQHTGGDYVGNALQARQRKLDSNVIGASAHKNPFGRSTNGNCCALDAWASDGGHDALEAAETWAWVRRRMPYPGGAILHWIFIDGMTYAQVGRRVRGTRNFKMGVTESRICQMLPSILKAARQLLEGEAKR